MRRIAPNLSQTSLFLTSNGHMRSVVADATVTTVNRGSRSSVLPRLGRLPRRAALKRPAQPVSTGISSEAKMAKLNTLVTGEKLLLPVQQQQQQQLSVVGDVISSSLPTITQNKNSRLVTCDSEEAAMSEPQQQAEHKQTPQHDHQQQPVGVMNEEEEEEDSAVEEPQVFDSLLSEQLEASVEMEMVEEAIKEDQEIHHRTVEQDGAACQEGQTTANEAAAVEAAVEERKEKAEEGEMIGRNITATAAVQAVAAEGAAAEAASAKEQRRQEKKKNSYSIPALCQVRCVVLYGIVRLHTVTEFTMNYRGR